jgi:hypothetical protein
VVDQIPLQSHGGDYIEKHQERELLLVTRKKEGAGKNRVLSRWEI